MRHQQRGGGTPKILEITIDPSLSLVMVGLVPEVAQPVFSTVPSLDQPNCGPHKTHSQSVTRDQNNGFSPPPPPRFCSLYSRSSCWFLNRSMPRGAAVENPSGRPAPRVSGGAPITARSMHRSKTVSNELFRPALATELLRSWFGGKRRA